jgi:flagellar assembly protein FliH
LSESAVSFDFEQLEPSAPPPRDAPARLLAKAQDEAEALREQARAEGHAAGVRAGREQGMKAMASATSALGEALAGVEALRADVAGNVDRDAIELALALAGKILAATLQVRPEAVVEVVQGALRRVGGQRRIVIFVNPADLELVREALGDGPSASGGSEPPELQADQRVAVGGAIVRTAEGEVDARIQTQLERAREVALAELGGETAGA